MAPPASASIAAESESISFNASSAKEANFEAKAKWVVLSTTASVHIAFDRPANSDDFMLPANAVVEFPVEFTRVSALGVSGSGTLYILALR